MGHRALVLSAALLSAIGCGSEAPSPDLAFPAMAPLAGPAGRGGFRFGASTAATQIEDGNSDTDWYVFTARAPDGLGRGAAFVGDASGGYTRALDDVGLAKALHLDSYRMSVEWARVEPRRGQLDETALAHYGAVLDALRAAGIRPMVTVHHFSMPVWVDDPRDPDCAAGPGDSNLCGLVHPQGGPLVLAALRAHARLLGERFGDRVDEWCTVNEPAIYLVNGFGTGSFAPGRSWLFDFRSRMVPAARALLAAHAAIWQGLHEGDGADADGDGAPVAAGPTIAASEWVPARGGEPSDEPEDLEARDTLERTYEYFFPDALRTGMFDADLDGTAEEAHPDWKGTFDFLGIQYYSRAGVTGAAHITDGLPFFPCLSIIDPGACVPPQDPSFVVPSMGYEYSPAGLRSVLERFAKRYPDTPLVVTEAGIATQNGARRAQVTVRSLEQIERARAAGVDVRGLYHWSLVDNFEWALGFGPRFGLYRVDYATFARTPTEGANVLGEIARTRRVTAAQRARYGGTGSMDAEVEGP